MDIAGYGTVLPSTVNHYCNIRADGKAEIREKKKQETVLWPISGPKFEAGICRTRT
jgi:hypothetical protein